MKGRWMILLLGAILATFLVAGCAAINYNGTETGEKEASNAVQKTPTPAQKNDSDTISVIVYFGAHDAQHLEAEVHSLKKDAMLMQLAMKILVEGPKNPNLWPVVPPATKVKGVMVKERIAYVDFSDEMVKHGLGGSSREILAVSAIVNTMTEFPEVERVQILVDGNKVNTLFGHMDVSEPLGRSPGIIKEK